MYVPIGGLRSSQRNFIRIIAQDKLQAQLIAATDVLSLTKARVHLCMHLLENSHGFDIPNCHNLDGLFDAL